MLFSSIIKKKFDLVLGRYDEDPAMYYPSLKDFPGLEFKREDVKTEAGLTLFGGMYFYPDPNSAGDKPLVIFVHGTGAGHTPYLNEIHTIAKAGYGVYAYDNSGCARSDGEGIKGFAQAANDLDQVLKHFDAKNSPLGIILVGHSLGAYACMNVAALHTSVIKIVSLSGFVSAEALVSQYIPKAFQKYVPEVMAREKENNPEFAKLNAVNMLQKTKAKLLHLQSRDDKKVSYAGSMELLKKSLENRPDTYFIELDDRNHDPQRTPAAARAEMQMQEELTKARKKKKLNTLDQQKDFCNAHNWALIREQDEGVWAKILEFMDN